MIFCKVVKISTINTTTHIIVKYVASYNNFGENTDHTNK